MSVELEQHQVEWLSLVRYQLEMAEAQGAQPEPLNALSISMTHDAVESMLSLVAEVQRADIKPKADFSAMFDSGSRAVDGGIAGYRSQMLALNSARVSFKHHGNRLDEQTIRRHLANSRTFLEDLAMKGLEVSFDEVSLLLFVRNDRVRALLESAQTSWSAGVADESFQDLSRAFDELLCDYEERKSWYPGKSLFSTKPNLVPSVFDIRDSGKSTEKAFEWLEALDGWVRILALGINARDYAYFQAHTPGFEKVMNGSYYFFWQSEPDQSDAVFGRCLQFVVETALLLGRDDFDFDAWAARRPAGDQGSTVQRVVRGSSESAGSEDPSVGSGA
ncbi:MAG: hypothetical protein L0J71_05305 [Bifidobacterium crudilactis]|nr:hypothetical protein [Bifidobacterium crudilactis]